MDCSLSASSLQEFSRQEYWSGLGIHKFHLPWLPSHFQISFLSLPIQPYCLLLLTLPDFSITCNHLYSVSVILATQILNKDPQTRTTIAIRQIKQRQKTNKNKEYRVEIRARGRSGKKCKSGHDLGSQQLELGH